MQSTDADSVLEPHYSLTRLDPTSQWWWFEGHFWGRQEEILKQDGLHLAYKDLLRQRDERIQAQELIIRALRHDFTYSPSGGRNA